MPSGNTHPGLSLAGSRQRLRLQVSRCGFTWFSASFFSFTSPPPPSPLLVSRVGVKRAIILMHLFMGVIKISARQRVRESSCAALNEPPTRSLSRSGWSIIGRAISSRNTDSNHEDGIAEGRWTKRSQLPDRWSCCVCERSRDFGSFMVREDAWAWRGKKYSRSQVYRVSEDFLPGGGGKRRRCQVKR